MESKTLANPKFKDSFFTKLFSEPQSILKLYNALSESQYPLDTPIEITTLENVLYQGRYNDLSFVVDGKLVVLIEHQSSINPNMPIRLLIYLSHIYGKRFMGKKIHSSQLVKIPRPEFIVLYNGTEDYPDEKTIKLSDAFFTLPEGHNPSGGLELTVRVLNINKGHNESIVRKSVELDGYAQIVDEIRKNKEAGMSLNDAIAKAVKDCSEKNILRDFLEKYGGEIMEMLYAEWSLDDFIAVQREEASAEAEHKKSIRTAQRALKKGMSIEEAADFAELTIEEVKKLVNA